MKSNSPLVRPLIDIDRKIRFVEDDELGENEVRIVEMFRQVSALTLLMGPADHRGALAEGSWTTRLPSRVILESLTALGHNDLKSGIDALLGGRILRRNQERGYGEYQQGPGFGWYRPRPDAPKDGSDSATSTSNGGAAVPSGVGNGATSVDGHTPPAPEPDGDRALVEDSDGPI
jgi:hypothetical protein